MRAKVVVKSPEACPVTDLADSDDETVEVVSRGNDVEEVVLSETPSNPDFDSFSRIFRYDDGGVFRFARPDECACDRLEAVGVPVSESRFEEGRLWLTFHVEDTDQLQRAVEKLRERAEAVSVRQLVDSDAGSDPTTISTVDMADLTERQSEILRVAYRHGYFEQPRRASVSDLATELDLSPSTVTQHLYTAMGKIFGQILD
ncbi:helix-turn-helix domain-containing protein [Halorussus salinus]|uniref:helix-turn-helix domain-containing protein n=1 Tax=Halorussus salinus TaxID=1364935 RepID=UPI001092700D|nr:helix-turn-helix domain-containing protein [Halorussus salinus]